MALSTYVASLHACTRACRLTSRVESRRRRYELRAPLSTPYIPLPYLVRGRARQRGRRLQCFVACKPARHGVPRRNFCSRAVSSARALLRWRAGVASTPACATACHGVRAHVGRFDIWQLQNAPLDCGYDTCSQVTPHAVQVPTLPPCTLYAPIRPRSALHTTVYTLPQPRPRVQRCTARSLTTPCPLHLSHLRPRAPVIPHLLRPRTCR